MKPWIWMRIASILQGIGTVLHTISTQHSITGSPAEQAVFDAMRSFRFDGRRSFFVITSARFVPP